MGKSITQNDLNTKGAFDAAVTFFNRFHIGSALKAANEGIPLPDLHGPLPVRRRDHTEVWQEVEDRGLF